MESCVDVLKKRVEELEKKNRVLELQLKAKENLVNLMEKQMEEKATFYSNALLCFTTTDTHESKLLLQKNENLVSRSKRSRTSLAN